MKKILFVLAFFTAINGFGQNFPYAELSKKMDGGIYIVPNDDIIHLKYREEYNTDNFKFSIYNYDNSVSYNQNTISVTTATGYGDNRIEIPLNVLPSGHYTLEVVNDKNEKWYLRFKY